MPTTKSAKKRLRQNEKRRLRNRSVKSVLRSKVRKVREAIDAKDVATAESEYRAMARKLDQAATGRVIHTNKAARTKSRLQKQIKSLKVAASS